MASRLIEVRRRLLYGNNIGAAASYSGAFDGTTGIFVAYGMRRLLASYTGSLIRIRDTTNNNELDVGYTATGNLDTAAITTFLGGHSAAVVTWYDQSGGGRHVTQATAGSQPAYSASAQNGKPGVVFGSSKYLSKASVAWTASPLTAFTVFMSDNAAGYRTLFANDISNSGIFFMHTFNSGTPRICGAGFGLGTSSFNVTSSQTFQNDAAWHQHDAQLAAGGCDWKVDGAALAGTATTADVPSITDTFVVGAAANGAGVVWDFSGGIGEIAIVAGAVSSGSRATLRANQKAYWGTP